MSVIRENRLNLKSFYYNVISNNYSIYLSDIDDTVLISTLVCADCNSKWHTGLQECFLCGTENYHVYTCTNCDEKYSITRANTNCSTCAPKLKKTLIPMCVNKECLSNTDPYINEAVVKQGGTFASSKSGFSIRQVSCKKCGSSHNIYKSVIVNIVDSENEVKNIKDVFINRPDFDSPASSYITVNENNENESFPSINGLVEFLFENFGFN